MARVRWHFGLELIDPPDFGLLYGPMMLEGRSLDSQAMNGLFQEIKMVTGRMTADAVKVDAEAPWMSHRAAELDRVTTARWLEALPVSRLLAYQRAKYNGCAVDARAILECLHR